MKEFYKYNKERLTDYVLNIKDKKMLLSDEEFKDYLLKEDNHCVFIELLYKLNKEDVKMLLTLDYLEKIIDSDTNALHKYGVILEYHSDIFIKTSNKVKAYIINNFSEYFKIVCQELGEHLAYHIVYFMPDKMSQLKYFSKEVQNKVLDLQALTVISKLNGFEKILINLSPKVINKSINSGIFSSIIKDLDKEELAQFSNTMKNEDLLGLINNSEFIISISSIENPNYYRYIINNLLINNYELANKIEKYRLSYIICQFDLKNSEGIFENYIVLVDKFLDGTISKSELDRIPEEIEYFYGIKINTRFLKELTIKRKKQLLCDYYFKDYSENVLHNLKEIVRFDNDRKIISNNNLELYNKFLNFEILSDESINELLSSANKEDYSKMLYNDILACKRFSYELYNNEFFKPNNSNLRNESMSKKFGLDVYNLNGEKFLACVHCGRFYEGKNKKTISLSIIGSENIGLFDKTRVIVGYTYLDPSKIMHVYNKDSYTDGQIGTNRINKIYKPHELLENTYFYNEILYSEKNYQLIPDYVICVDNIDTESYNYAKENNLPIVIINSSKYKISCNYTDDIDYRDTYLTREEDYYGTSK